MLIKKRNSPINASIAFVILLSYSTGNHCSSSEKPTFSDQITTAYREFKQKDDYNRYCRYLCYGVLGTGVFLAIFNNTFPRLSRIQDQALYAKVQEIDARIKQAPVEPKKNNFPYIRSFISHCKPIFDYTIKVFTPGSIAAYVIDKVTGNFSYGLIKPIVEPFQRFMNIQQSIAIGDIWFLREQVRNPAVTFVVVSTDLANFVDELKVFDIELRHATLLLNTSTSLTTPSPALDDMLESSQQRITNRLARIIAHIAYMQTKATNYEQLAMKVLYSSVRSALERTEREFTASYNADITAKKQALAILEQSLRCALLPLLSISLYRIHPWPVLAACNEQARASATESFVATYGNPAS